MLLSDTNINRTNPVYRVAETQSNLQIKIQDLFIIKSRIYLSCLHGTRIFIQNTGGVFWRKTWWFNMFSLQMYCQRNALAINVSGTIHLRALMLVSYLKRLSGCLSQCSSGGFLYQSGGLSSVSCHRPSFGMEHSSKKPQKTKTDCEPLLSGWDLLQWGVLQVSFLVPFHREDTPTHLYFDSYRQGVQLFVQFLENNKLFQCETAQPVEEREKERN